MKDLFDKKGSPVCIGDFVLDRCDWRNPVIHCVDDKFDFLADNKDSFEIISFRQCEKLIEYGVASADADVVLKMYG